MLEHLIVNRLYQTTHKPSSILYKLPHSATQGQFDCWLEVLLIIGVALLLFVVANAIDSQNVSSVVEPLEMDSLSINEKASPSTILQGTTQVLKDTGEIASGLCFSLELHVEECAAF